MNFSSTTPSYGLVISGAVYGLQEITSTVQDQYNKGVKTFKADNKTFGDSWVGIKKTLVIVYSLGGTSVTLFAKEGDSLTLP